MVFLLIYAHSGQFRRSSHKSESFKHYSFRENGACLKDGSKSFAGIKLSELVHDGTKRARFHTILVYKWDLCTLCMFMVVYQPIRHIWVFPKIWVPPNPPILIGFSIINHPFWGTSIFGNTHIEVRGAPIPPHKSEIPADRVGPSRQDENHLRSFADRLCKEEPVRSYRWCELIHP